MGKNFLSGFVIVLGGVAALMGVYAFQWMTTNPSTAGNQSLMSPLLARPGTTYNPDYHSLNLIANFVGIKEPKLTGVKHIFLTKTTYDGNLGGLAGADEKCQAAANAYGVPGSYIAFLGDSTTTFKARYGADIERTNYIFAGLSENTLFSNYKGLFTWDSVNFDLNNIGYVSNYMRYEDKIGVGSSFYFWSNTNNDGNTNNPYSYNFCNNWTSTTGSSYYGQASSSGYQYYVGNLNCTTKYRLLCIEK